VRTNHSACCALWLCAAASVLSACGALQSPLSPVSSAQYGAPGLSGHKAGGDLMYVGAKKVVEIYTFPAGIYQGAFDTQGLLSAMCSDSKGNVYIAVTDAGSGYVYEYSHGGVKPIATLDAPTRDVPISCSSDPISGNLAVTLQNSRDYAPSVAIYPKGAGTPKIYFSRVLGANPQAGYDDRGDLFATSGGNVAAELRAGKTRFVEISFSKTLGGVAHVQWDGTNMALQSFDYSTHNGEKIFERIFRLQISGTMAKIVGTSRFHNWSQKDAGESWIQGGEIAATPFGAIVLWAYPGGGKALKVIHPVHRGKAITVSIGE
jgi:hypothetical protein